MVLQVKSLLEMARSIPRPKNISARGPTSPSRGTVNGISQARTIPPSLRDNPSAVPNAGSPGRNVTPPRTGVQTSSSSSPYRPASQQDNANSSSPYRYYPRDNGSTPPRQTSKASFQSSPKKADYLEPPKVSRKSATSLLDQEEPDSRPTQQPAQSSAIRNQYGQQQPVSFSSNSTPRAHGNSSTPGQSMDARSSGSPASQYQRQPLQQGVFRQARINQKVDQEKMPPPVLEVAVSNDEDDDGLYDPAALPRSGETDIFISPHYVPHMSPHKVNMSSNTGETPSSRTSSTFSHLPVSPGDELLEVGNGSAIQKQYSYDAEESCLLTDGLRRGDEPLPDDYNASLQSKGSESSRRIMVMRPYRSSPGESIGSPTSFGPTRKKMNAFGHDEDDGINSKGATAATRDSLYGSDMDYSSKTSSWSSQAHRNERQVTLAKARALLQANEQYLDSPQLQLAGKPPFLHSPDRIKQQLFHQSDAEGKNPEDEGFSQDLEDGLAPLGVDDTLGASRPPRRYHRGMLTDHPESYLREIYGEASRCMKNHYYTEAIECFYVILECQRRKHGPFHQDVASALHNCGLAHLRANNNHDALKAFEEAVRIRKGTLGKDHPQVAASLVKCGITFLLLHRFEEALWSFREALSVRKHALGTLHPSTARIYNNIGCVHVEFNELREARRAFEAALDIQRNALCTDPASGPVRFGASTTLCNLGYLYRYRGMHEKAALVLKEAANVSVVVCLCCL